MSSLLSLAPFAALSPARQRALYSDFAPQRTTNPPGFKANVAWWSALVHLAAEQGSLADGEEGHGQAEGSGERTGCGVVLDVGDELVERLRVPGGGRPLALGTVIEEMVASSTLVPTASFLPSSALAAASSSSTSATSSTASLPLRVASTLLVTPLLWSFRQLGLSSGSSAGHAEAGDRVLAKVQGSYIVKPVLEKVTSQVLARARARPHSLLSETLFTPASFRLALCPPSTTALESLVLVAELERRGLAGLSPDGQVIKLVLDGSLPAAFGKRPAKVAVGEVERGVLAMHETIATLEAQMADLETRIAERSTGAKAALAKGLKSQAVALLRSRKELEAVLDKRAGSLGTLRGVLLQIDSSAGDVAILKAYETSTTTLRALLALPELDRARVDGTLDGLVDALADQAEIESAVRLGPGAAGEEADEGDLERELEALVSAQKEGEARGADERALEARARERERVAERRVAERTAVAAAEGKQAQAAPEKATPEGRTAVLA